MNPHLPCGVLDVQEAGLGVDDGPLLVGVLDRGVVVVDEVVLHVLEGEGGLAHPTVTQHHDPVPARGTGGYMGGGIWLYCQINKQTANIE